MKDIERVMRLSNSEVNELIDACSLTASPTVATLRDLLIYVRHIADQRQRPEGIRLLLLPSAIKE